MTISSSKTEVQVIGRDVSQLAIHIKLGSGELKQVDKFVSVAQFAVMLLVTKTLLGELVLLQV